MKRLLGKMPIYLLLIVGSAVFAFPFAWMASTSVKVDRELFSDRIRLKPLTPSALARSPYVDTEYYVELPGAPEHQGMVLPHLQELAVATGYTLPTDLNAPLAWQQIARGLYRKLARTLPQVAWEGGEKELVTAAQQAVTAGMVGEIFSNIDRRLSLGTFRVRSTDLKEEELLAGRPISQQLENLSPAVATLVDRQEDNRKCADIVYDFGAADQIRFAQTFTLGFPVSQLQRVQLNLRPDDAWHELTLMLEAKGKVYVARRSVPLANFEWWTLTWQWPSEDDASTKIRTWILLDEKSGQVSSITDPRQVRLTLSLDRAGAARAWWNKLRLNYDRVLDQIPFGRYVRVSLFLVIANIALTLVFSSLTAYAFARLNWPGREFCFMLMLATMMIPGQVTMIPNFLIWKSVGAFNTLSPLWLGAAFGNAFFIFLLRQFMRGIPRDLEDAARIDGCGFLRIYWHVILPLIKPSLAAIAIFTFMGTWNDFMGPLLYIADQRLYSLAFGLYAFSVQVGGNPTLTMAGSLLMTVPVIVLFFFAQKYFIQGVTLTGMKG